MSGIYIHIPFCVKKCSYCDFYSNTDISDKDTIVSTIVDEILLRKSYLSSNRVETIYLGGGTPSLLSIENLELIIESIDNTFEIDRDVEFTIEVNPNDLSKRYLSDLKRVGINRISIGIQSFNDRILSFLGRRHSAQEAIDAIKLSKEAGITNISIDLIYGIPGLSIEDWKGSLDKCIEVDVSHVSAYHLTYHKGTSLYDDLKRAVFKEMDSEISLEQFKLLCSKLESGGFNMYEISNFSKSNNFSRHNSSYWKGVEYLGVGPSAHSFDGVNRRWNISSNSRYRDGVKLFKSSQDLTEIDRVDSWFTEEKLTIKDRYNDYIITSLRTVWGVDISYVENNFGSYFVDQFKSSIDKHVTIGNIVVKANIYTLSKRAIFISDSILLDVFYID